MLGAAYFSVPHAEAPRYLAIETRSDPMGPVKKHHVEMYNPQLLHPTERDNVFIWAAHDLRKVRNWESLCVLLMKIHRLVCLEDNGHVTLV